MDLNDVGDNTWSLIVGILVFMMCGFYLWELLKSYSWRGGKRRIQGLDGVEAFANPTGGAETRIDGDCYDEFYAKVYDQLVQPQARAPMETKVAIEWMQQAGRDAGDLRVADIGCGTGLHVDLFARQGVRSVIGYDKSKDMIAEAKRRYPDRDFRVGDATVATMAAADQFDLVTMYYFGIYMIPDRRTLLRNIYLWLAPGGVFVVHLVNKLKFDPVLEASSPFVGFSVQKYADDRITKSSVTFQEFDYEGDFQLNGSRGVYEEEFQFRDGRMRRHEQKVWMPNIDAIVSEINGAGFKYAHHVDLTAIGYEYQYGFVFQK
jgi:SAM-dependent methyltransferase